ncbi:hypothetical protein DXN04_32500 [Chitinophaga silvisoli]|uniref:Uncharacterized protein n=1 Tax=Chitinophaga silvisoli TaxID=2291814 RepID=A0A3E1NSD9_9BACT|nr:hypothetical protein DXN04_32500 [Chitinophaga silvisoli]
MLHRLRSVTNIPYLDFQQVFNQCGFPQLRGGKQGWLIKKKRDFRSFQLLETLIGNTDIMALTIETRICLNLENDILV